MGEKSVFTFLAKYTKYSFIGVLLLLVLTGCSGINDPIGPDSTGFFDHNLVYPFSLLLKGFASLLGGDYGLSIIALTIIIRLILMPLMLKQMKSSYSMREKMGTLKPEMDAVKNKYKGKKDKESQMNMQQEMMELYKKHNMNPLSSMGCLPMVIQFPIIIAFYYAIRRTPDIAGHSFLWFNLGQTDMILPLIAAAVYYFQFKVTQIGADPKQKKQMAFMGLISPLMIGFISFSTPAALPLYWTVSATFVICQTWVAKRLYMNKPAEANIS